MTCAKPPGSALTPQAAHRARQDEAVLRTGLPIPGVTAAGRPVYAEPPDVLLPPGPGRWRVEARRGGSGAVVGRVTASGDAWQPDSVWRKAPRPLLGELTITATAVDRPVKPVQPVPGDTPGLRRTVVVAESLSVASYPAPRLTSPRGLEPGETRLPNELLSRAEMRDTPPHLLLTNYAMLEYLLLRPADMDLFEGPHAGHWRFVVLDEAHVYDGAKAEEVGMLLRRLKHKVFHPERFRGDRRPAHRSAGDRDERNGR